MTQKSRQIIGICILFGGLIAWIALSVYLRHEIGWFNEGMQAFTSVIVGYLAWYGWMYWHKCIELDFDSVWE